MSDDPVQPPIYSDAQMNIYEAESTDELKRQVRAQWAREASEGAVSPQDIAYRLRQLATQAKNWPMIPCEKCGEPGAAPLYVFGSSTGVVKFIEEGLGVAVPGGRERLLMAHEASKAFPAEDGDYSQMCSVRVLVFCGEHAPPTNLAIEPGYEDIAKHISGVKSSE